MLVLRAQKELSAQIWACTSPNGLFLEAVLNFGKSDVEL